MKKMMLITLLSLIIIISFTGCSNLGEAGKDFSEDIFFPLPALDPTTTITKSAKEMTLSLNDFPLGWQLEKRGLTGVSNRREFTNGTQTIQVKINVFPTIEETMGHYSSAIPDNLSFDTVSQGNEGIVIAYPTKPIYRVVFRRNNVLVLVTTTSISLSETLEWAQIVDERIFQ